MEIIDRKKNFRRRLLRILTVLVPLAVFGICLCSLAGQADGEDETPSGVCINELAAKNLTGLTDQNGQPVDWIELYNPTGSAVSLAGAGLSDEPGKPYLWVFPAYTMQPGEYLVVYADGLDCTDESGFHTNFLLSGNGGVLCLTAADGTQLDKLRYPAQEWDVPYGRLQSDPAQLGSFAAATPGRANPSVFWGGESSRTSQESEVIFSQKAGSYTQAFELEMQASQSGALILYTLDGSEPDMGSMVYTGSVTIRDLTGTPNRYVSVLSSTQSLGGDTRTFYWTDEDGKTHLSASKMLEYMKPELDPVSKGVTVRARTYQDGQLGEAITTATYFVNAEEGFPRVSITADPEKLFDSKTGMLVPGAIHWTAASVGADQSQNIADFMMDTSAAANCEIFSAEGQVLTSESGTLKLSGNASRLEKQKSFIFTSSSGRSIKLRTQHNNNVTYYPYLEAFWKNYLCDEGIGAIESQFVDLYISGEYWGIYSMQDSVTEYLSKTTGAERDEIDLCKFKSLIAQENTRGIVVENGGKTAEEAFRQFREEVYARDFRSAEDLQWMESQMELDNLVRYLAAEFYLQNSDWETNNIAFWRTETRGENELADGRWRQILFDLDMTMGFVSIDSIASFFESDFSEGTSAQWEAELEQTIAERQDREEQFFTVLVYKLWLSPEFRQRFKKYAMDAYSENGIYGAKSVTSALQAHFDQLEPQMQRNLARLYGTDGIEERMKYWHQQCQAILDFAEERADYMLWYTNRACY